MTTTTTQNPRPRLVLVTGVGKAGQVGEVVASAFARTGARLLLVARRLEESAGRAAEIRGQGGDAVPYAADLADAADVERLARAIAGEHGSRIDALVHLAGGWSPGAPVADSTPEQWEVALSRNLYSAVHTARAFVPALREARGAAVFFASEAVLPGGRVAGLAAYAAAKSGVVVLARALAQEEQRHGVRVNVLAPGSIRTASNEAGMGSDAAYVEREDVADAVLWLCSPAAAAINGEVIRLSPSRRAAERRPSTAPG